MKIGKWFQVLVRLSEMVMQTFGLVLFVEALVKWNLSLALLAVGIMWLWESPSRQDCTERKAA